MMDKNIQVEEIVNKLKNIAKTKINKKKYNTALAAISCAAGILYTFNQKYADDDLEKLTSDIGDNLKSKYDRANYKECTDTILVYDGFGLDTRGVVLMYLNALGLDILCAM